MANSAFHSYLSHVETPGTMHSSKLNTSSWVDCWVRLKYIYVPFLTAAAKQNEKKNQALKLACNGISMLVKDSGTGTEIKISIAIQGMH